MATCRTFALLLMTVVLAAMGALPAHGQFGTDRRRGKTLARRSKTIELKLSIPSEHIPVGQKPYVFLTVKNLSNTEISYPEDRVHVEGREGEPPTTLYQRRVTHRLRPGEQQFGRFGGYEPSIEAGASLTGKFDLGLYYDLSKPGKYKVYIEALDVSESAQKWVWVRSNTVRFKIQAPAQ